MTSAEPTPPSRSRFNAGPTGLGTAAARLPARPGIDRAVQERSTDRRPAAAEAVATRAANGAARAVGTASARASGGRIPSGPTGLGTTGFGLSAVPGQPAPPVR
ncbi:hypothetical protein OG455_03765 [Kitasatospora sp. NBC_01287]|uniref:hypothetical protein n=1 Tax=Kitasatospora sp. NBC_01287 TaxID=2903573 RepID=UPI00224F8FC1|nr:hypothetical protein [Kitasatospora sp. NBC_01287]MCX4744647.1 hypothetical protein [Kitasatospora sp. NBC_01287]